MRALGMQALKFVSVHELAVDVKPFTGLCGGCLQVDRSLSRKCRAEACLCQRPLNSGCQQSHSITLLGSGENTAVGQFPASSTKDGVEPVAPAETFPFRLGQRKLRPRVKMRRPLLIFIWVESRVTRCKSQVSRSGPRFLETAHQLRWSSGTNLRHETNSQS